MSAALQVYSRDFDADFFQLPAEVQARIQHHIDRLGVSLDRFPRQRLKGIEAYRMRVGNYRIIYDFDRSRGDSPVAGRRASARGLPNLNRGWRAEALISGDGNTRGVGLGRRWSSPISMTLLPFVFSFRLNGPGTHLVRGGL